MAIKSYKTKKGVRYQAELYLQGKRVASKAGFETKKDAKKWMRDEERQREKYGQQATTRMDFGSLASEYLTYIQDRRKRNTYIYKRSTFRRFLSFFHPSRMFLAEIDRDNISKFHKAQKDDRGPKAANRDLKEIVTIFNWAMKQGHMIKNPALPVEPYSEEDFVRYVPPAEDIAAVRMAATPQERQIIDTLYYTAARLSEILNLTWEDVNLENSALRLWTSKRRGGDRQFRILAIHPELHKVLNEAWNQRDKSSPYVFTNPLTEKQYTRHNAFIRELFQRLCKKAEIEKPFTAHCIRHHVASRFADSRKATPRQIQKFLGHMNLKTTERYMHELQVDHDILDAFEPNESKELKAENDT